MGPTLARKHEPQRRHRALDWLIYLLVCVIIGIGALGVHDMVFKATGVSGQERSTADQIGDVFRPAFPGRTRVRILIMGADKRPADDDPGRSDTLMLLSVNPQTKKAAVLGIPRDLKVEIPGHGRLDKINAAYNPAAYKGGGPQLVEQCVESVVGERMDFYTLAFFRGFVNAVNRLGGVWINVPDAEGQGHGMNYDEEVVVYRTCLDNKDHLHLHLKPGFQKLDGAAALGFVRFRHSTMYRDAHGNWAGGGADYDRSGRQQMFLKALAQQHLRLTEVHKLLMAASDVREHVDTDMTWNDVYDLVRVLKQIDPDDIWTGTLPGDDDPGFWQGGVYYYVLREDKWREMKDDMERHLDGLAPRPDPIEVLNASGVPGRANDAAQRLAAKGLPIASAGTVAQPERKSTLITYTKGHGEEARLAQSVLACGELAERKPEREPQASATDTKTSSEVSVRVELGSDYDPQKAAVLTGQAPPASSIPREANGPTR